MTVPGEFPINDIEGLDRLISEMMPACQMAEIVRGWFLGAEPRDQQVQTARYVGEKVIEHLIAIIDRRRT
jgi:hypothetical protein